MTSWLVEKIGMDHWGCQPRYALNMPTRFARSPKRDAGKALLLLWSTEFIPPILKRNQFRTPRANSERWFYDIMVGVLIKIGFHL
jgi:hypothetical protein